jgi:hypothetical protein
MFELQPKITDVSTDPELLKQQSQIPSIPGKNEVHHFLFLVISVYLHIGV